MLELRRSGLRGGNFPFSDEFEGFRWRLLEGELTCGESGRTVEEAALSESCFSECDSAVSFLVVDGGKGAVSSTTLFGGECDIAIGQL